MNLKTKLWMLIVASSIIGLSVFILASWMFGSLFNKGYTHVTLDGIGTELVKEAEINSTSTDQMRDVFLRFQEQHPRIQLEWFTADGELLYASDGRTQPYRFRELMNRFVEMPSGLWTTGRDITLVFEGRSSAHYLVMTVPNEAMQSKQLFLYVRNPTEFLQLLLPAVLIIAIPYGFALFFFSHINHRLKKLNQAMKTMDTQQTSIVEDPSKDEIGQLTRHFNVMSTRIHEQVSQIQEIDQKRKSLISNISHDLRTPMTMIQGYAETLHDDIVLSDTDRKKYTEIILRRSRYMNQLLQKLLEIAQLDSHKDQTRLQWTDVSELLRRIAADYVQLSENRGIELDIQISESPIHARIDPYLIERAVRNLIDNAIQYGESGNYVKIAFEIKEDQLEISIQDRGPGIMPEQQAVIFERFYRGADGRGGEGLGIGLSIVKEIASAHQGSVRIRSIPHEETTFTLCIAKEKTGRKDTR